MTESTPPPAAWANLIEGLTILARHPANEGYPLALDHEQLFVMALAESFTEEELARLETLGFLVNRESGWSSFEIPDVA